jgi:multidrug resistance efflux pump
MGTHLKAFLASLRTRSDADVTATVERDAPQSTATTPQEPLALRAGNPEPASVTPIEPATVVTTIPFAAGSSVEPRESVLTPAADPKEGERSARSMQAPAGGGGRRPHVRTGVAPVLRRYVGAALLAGCALTVSLFTFEYQYVGELSGVASAGRIPNVFSGIVRPSSDSTIAATAPVLIEQVLVEPGQTVRAGDPLFIVEDREARQALPAARLEAEDAALEVEALELQLGALDRELQELSLRFTNVTGELEIAARRTTTIPTPQVRSSTERAQAAFDLATMKLDRTRQLHRQGLVARQEVDDAEIALRVAQDDVASAQRAEQAFKEAADVEASRARLRAELVTAQEVRERQQRSAALARARIRHQRALAVAKAFEDRVTTSRIEAAAAGTIAEIRVSRGDVVSSGAVLARIADLAQLIAEVQVPSEHVPQLRIGAAADVSISAASPVSARGVIRSIEPTPGANGTHRVVVSFTAPGDSILTGQAANVSFPGANPSSVRSRL